MTDSASFPPDFYGSLSVRRIERDDFPGDGKETSRVIKSDGEEKTNREVESDAVVGEHPRTTFIIRLCSYIRYTCFLRLSCVSL